MSARKKTAKKTIKITQVNEGRANVKVCLRKCRVNLPRLLKSGKRQVISLGSHEVKTF